MLRHAPTAWNVDHRLQGRTDIPLSPAGRALLTRWHLPTSFEGTALWTSPLRRARETAERFGTPRSDDRLIERAWGEWEGARLRDLRVADSAKLAAAEARGIEFAAPGGESPRAVAARLDALFADVQGEHKIVLVTHRGVMQAALALAVGWAFDTKPPIAVRTGVGWHLVLENGRPVGLPREVALEQPAVPCGS